MIGNGGKVAPAEDKAAGGGQNGDSSGAGIHSPAAANKSLGDYFHDKRGKLRKAKGLHWVLAALFVVADMAGGTYIQKHV